MSDEFHFQVKAGNARVGAMENAPPWWPNFEPSSFSEEELYEIERYCQKIVKNCKDEEGMTPWERWKATLDLQIPDRPFVYNQHLYASSLSRVMDNWGEVLKPGQDLYWYPKLALKATLLWSARFKTDSINPYVFTYCENEYGPNHLTRLLPLAGPAFIKHNFDYGDDWSKIHAPDVYRDGFYPPTIWVVRKLKEFMKKHGVADYLPMFANFCSSPEMAGGYILGTRKFTIALKRDIELIKKCAELDLPWRVAFAKALKEEGADQVLCCRCTPGWCSFEIWKQLNYQAIEMTKALEPIGGYTCMCATDQSHALEYMCETGSMPKSFNSDKDMPYEFTAKVAQKYKRAYSPYFDAVMLSSGPAERIDGAIKAIVKSCAGPGFWATNPASEYYAKSEWIDLAERTYKEYGREVFKTLRK